jgi:(p)ppGpp synthase/HD superfamily hydrolase
MKDINDWQAKFEPCQYSDRLINKLLLLNKAASNPVDIQEVKKAIYYAKKYHGDQKRYSGELYYSHPIEVAYMVADYLFKTDIIVTSILHDTIEDTTLTKEIIASIFGEKVASQVEDLTRIKKDRKISSGEMVISLWRQKKFDLLLVKLFDRKHNMMTLGSKPPEKRQKIALETLEIFVVLSAHFRTLKIEQELIELCYQHLLVKSPLYQLQVQQEFSFEDSFQLPFPVFQNEVSQMRNLSLMEL